MTDAKPPANGGPAKPGPRPNDGPDREERLVIRDNRKIRVTGTAKPPKGASVTPDQPVAEAATPKPTKSNSDKSPPAEPTATESTSAKSTPTEPTAAESASANEPSAPEPAVSKSEESAPKAPEPKPSASKASESEPPEPATAETETEAEPTQAALAEARALVDQLQAAVDERTQDLQRVTAEYANYRRRAERDRARAGEEAVANVFRELLPVFDDLDRAREHGELSDGVSAVVDQLIANVGKFGLTGFGEPGDPFDPNRHEAVAHRTSPEVSGPTCVEVFRRGYLLGERLLRPAMVVVADPEE